MINVFIQACFPDKPAQKPRLPLSKGGQKDVTLVGTSVPWDCACVRLQPPFTFTQSLREAEDVSEHIPSFRRFGVKMCDIKRFIWSIRFQTIQVRNPSPLTRETDHTVCSGRVHITEKFGIFSNRQSWLLQSPWRSALHLCFCPFPVTITAFLLWFVFKSTLFPFVSLWNKEAGVCVIYSPDAPEMDWWCWGCVGVVKTS